MTAPWPLVPLREVVQPVERTVAVEPGHSYRTIGVRWWGEGAYERQTIDGSETAAKTLTLVRDGDLIINKIWVRHGSTAIAGKDVDGCAASGEFPTFVLFPNRIERGWLHWMTKSRTFWDKCDRLSQGTSGKNRVKPERFLTIEIPLPPLAEQRRIVARVEVLAGRIGEAKLLRLETQSQSAALVGQFTKEIFEKGAARGWQKRRLGDYLMSACYGTSEKTTDDRSGTPIFRMGNIQSGKLIVTNMRYLQLPSGARKKLILTQGDILINRTNSAELVGKCAVFDLKGDFGFASYLIRARIDQTKANPYLLTHYINSPTGRAYMFAEKKQMTGQANVNLATLRAMPVSLPPRDEQDAIVERISNMARIGNDIGSEQERVTRNLDALLPAILGKAFAGQL